MTKELDTFNMNFQRNRFSIRHAINVGWAVMDGNKKISEHKTYEEAEQVWSITCSTICIDALS